MSVKRGIGFSIQWLCMALLFVFCGCRSAHSVVEQTPSKLPKPPMLAPMPDYPVEQLGWDTNAVLVVFETPGEHIVYTQFRASLKDALHQRGYRVVDNLESLKTRQPPYVDTDWLSAEWRRQAKLIIITGIRAWGSASFEGKNSSDICLQILVIDQPYDGFNLSQAIPRVRTFHVWSRASHVDTTTWNDAYPLHTPQLAEHLMRMPGFRAALEEKPSVRVPSLSVNTAQSK